MRHSYNFGSFRLVLILAISLIMVASRGYARADSWADYAQRVKDIDEALDRRLRALLQNSAASPNGQFKEMSDAREEARKKKNRAFDDLLECQKREFETQRKAFNPLPAVEKQKDDAGSAGKQDSIGRWLGLGTQKQPTTNSPSGNLQNQEDSKKPTGPQRPDPPRMDDDNATSDHAKDGVEDLHAVQDTARHDNLSPPGRDQPKNIRANSTAEKKGAANPRGGANGSDSAEEQLQRQLIDRLLDLVKMPPPLPSSLAPRERYDHYGEGHGSRDLNDQQGVSAIASPSPSPIQASRDRYNRETMK